MAQANSDSTLQAAECQLVHTRIMKSSRQQVFASREHFGEVRGFVADANEQVLERLEAEVATIA